MFEDHTLKCKSCGKTFIVTKREAEFYSERGFSELPEYCQACRNRMETARTEIAEKEANTDDWECRITMRLPRDFDSDELLFLEQLGVKDAYTILPVEQHNYNRVKEICDTIRGAGLRISNFHSAVYTYNADICLNTSHRDEAIREYIDFIEMLGDLDIHVFTQTMMPYTIGTSGKPDYIRGAETRTVDLEDLKRSLPMQADREYSREELWDNFLYFLDKVCGPAEKAGVRIALHPNDPPVSCALGGIPPLINSFRAYREAFDAIGSEALAMEFCCGCWLEGGDNFGDLLSDMKWCLENNKIEMVHLRNITAPLPKFTECFLDNGYFDLYLVMKLLCDNNYQGVINPDHYPVMVDGYEHKWVPAAYTVGIMRAWAMRASAERKSSLLK